MAVLELFGKVDALRLAEKVPPPVLDRALAKEQEWGGPYPTELLEAESAAFKKLVETKGKFFDGSTGTPEHGRAGHKNPPPPGAGQ